MPQYTSAQMLTDGAGNPIPQRFNPNNTTQTPQGSFEPLLDDTKTFVRLSTLPRPEGIEGQGLYHPDTDQVFIHDGTDWREIE